VSLVHRESGDGEEEVLARHLQHSAQLCLQVRGLASGYSRDVHGQVHTVNHYQYQYHWSMCNIVIVQLSAAWRDSQIPVNKEAQFKLTDRTISLFAKGTSSAVL